MEWIYGLIGFAVLLGFIGLAVWGTHDSLVAGRLKAKESFSGIYVQLKRRADLIPRLVDAVKQYAQHEREIFDNVTRLRTEFLSIDKTDTAAVIQKGDELTQALRTVFAVAEAYPQVMASGNFKSYQEQLAETEDQIASARRIYNSNVTDYNRIVLGLISSIVAKYFGFKEEPYLEVDKALDKVPDAKFV